MSGLRDEVDVALCIDASGGMAPVLAAVRRRALDLPGDLRAAMVRQGKQVERLRVRVLVLRDGAARPDATGFMTGS